MRGPTAPRPQRPATSRHRPSRECGRTLATSGRRVCCQRTDAQLSPRPQLAGPTSAAADTAIFVAFVALCSRLICTGQDHPREPKAGPDLIRAPAMAFSETLATRICDAIAQNRGVEEKKMFGGVGFLL